LAKKARVYDGTAWQELASAQTDLTAYSTTAQMDTAIGANGWTAYTPTLTGFTLGTGGTMTARYTKIGKTVHGYVNITLGTSFTLTALSLSLPVAKQASTTYVNGVWTLVSTGAGDWPAINRYEATDVVAAYAMVASGTYVTPSNLSTTIPFTWKSTDKILVAFTMSVHNGL
jgi:hypothetical protein